MGLLKKWQNRGSMLVLLIAAIVLKVNGQGHVSGWFSAAQFVKGNINPAYISTGYTVLFPDSNVFITDKNSITKRPETYAAGHVFDIMHEGWAAVASTAANPVSPLAYNCPFVWDSISFPYAYRRGAADKNVKDTLYLYYYSNFSDTQLMARLLPVSPTDSMLLAFPPAFDGKELSGKKYFRKDTLLLDESDTASFALPKHITQSLQRQYMPHTSVKPNLHGLFGFSIVFKPGYVYKPGDTIVNTHDSSVGNANIFAVYQNSVATTGIGPLLSPRNAENSVILNKDNRYGAKYMGIQGFIPAYAQQYLTYFLCKAYVSSTSCPQSVKYAVKTETGKLLVSPNPVSTGQKITALYYAKNEIKVRAEIRNMLSALLYQSPAVWADNTPIEIGPILAAGLYYITIKDENTGEALAIERLAVHN